MTSSGTTAIGERDVIRRPKRLLTSVILQMPLLLTIPLATIQLMGQVKTTLMQALKVINRKNSLSGGTATTKLREHAEMQMASSYTASRTGRKTAMAL